MKLKIFSGVATSAESPDSGIPRSRLPHDQSSHATHFAWVRLHPDLPPRRTHPVAEEKCLLGKRRGAICKVLTLCVQNN